LLSDSHTVNMTTVRAFVTCAGREDDDFGAGGDPGPRSATPDGAAPDPAPEIVG